ncbi:MAG: hypothetical protein KF708_04035 [Pirellulales bacterium]|nr:hypothetical protein [Pirellulales bacterium]
MKHFLDAFCIGTNDDLIALAIANSPCELQFNTRSDLGEPGEKQWRVADDGTSFGPYRYPRDAKDQPDWSPLYLPYDPSIYCDAIGTTGFGQHGSFAVFFDLDTSLGHAKGSKTITPARRDEIVKSLAKLESVEVRRSTGGEGRTVVVYLDNIPTVNHTEHAALARFVLGKLCGDAGLDFAADVDVCGGNQWIWARRASAEKQSYKIIQPFRRKLGESDVDGWRAHIEVAQRKRSRARVRGVAADKEDEFAALVGGYPSVKRDATHDRIFGWMQKNGYPVEYVADLDLFWCHTAGLAAAHKALDLLGIFQTLSPGTDVAQPNCYVSLRRGGVFYVVRFQCQSEAPTWGKTDGGHASCYYNVPTNIKLVCDAVGGVWLGNDSFSASIDAATKAAKYFGVTLPVLTGERAITIKRQGDELVFEAERLGKESPVGWGPVGRKLKLCVGVDFGDNAESNIDVVRAVVTTEGDAAGWMLQKSDLAWTFTHADSHAAKRLKKEGLTGSEVDAILGCALTSPWTLVNEPFQGEFLPGRKWNRHAARLAYTPGEPGKHLHWNLIFDHLGFGLDDAVDADDWCAEHGIDCGADYLRLWVTLMLRAPHLHLPLLFLYSEKEGTGKSSLHRALSILFHRGCVAAIDCLTGAFNRPLAGCVLAHVEEDRIPREAAGKVKRYIESPTIPIRAMRTDHYELVNTSHWICSSNHIDAVPLSAGNTRVVMLEVGKLESEIEWPRLERELRAEAPSFLATINQIEIPPPVGRLCLPILETAIKRQAMELDAVEPLKLTADDTKFLDAVVKVMTSSYFDLDADGVIEGSAEELQSVFIAAGHDPGPKVRTKLKRIQAALAEFGISLSFLTRKQRLAWDGLDTAA